LCSRNKLFPFEALSLNMAFDGFVEKNNLYLCILILPLHLQWKNEKFKSNPIFFSILTQDLLREACSFKNHFSNYISYIWIYIHSNNIDRKTVNSPFHFLEVRFPLLLWHFYIYIYVCVFMKIVFNWTLWEKCFDLSEHKSNLFFLMSSNSSV
jgi:hypothetical protein